MWFLYFAALNTGDLLCGNALEVVAAKPLLEAQATQGTTERIIPGERRKLPESVRAFFRQSVIGLRHEAASFENFATSPATAGVVEVCRAFVAESPQGGKGLTLSGPSGTGKIHLAVAVTRALIDRGVSAVIVNVPMFLLTFRGTFLAGTGAVLLAAPLAAEAALELFLQRSKEPIRGVAPRGIARGLGIWSTRHGVVHRRRHHGRSSARKP